MTRRLTALKSKYQNEGDQHRPMLVDELSWSLYLAYVRDGKTLLEIGREHGLGALRVGRTVVRVDQMRVDQELQRPFAPEHERKSVTLDSPLEDLALSMRARNALRKLGCQTVRQVLDRDFTRASRRFGPISKREVAAALIRNGFTPPPTLEGRQSNVTALERDVSRLRRRIESSYQFWLDQVVRLEEGLRKLKE
jgi:hypothetical protein